MVRLEQYDIPHLKESIGRRKLKVKAIQRDEHVTGSKRRMSAAGLTRIAGRCNVMTIGLGQSFALANYFAMQFFLNASEVEARWEQMGVVEAPTS